MAGRLLLVLSVALFMAAEDKKEESDLKKVQGTWEVVGTEREGEKGPEDELKKAEMRLVIDDTKFTYTIGGMKILSGTFKFNEDKKTIDVDGTNADGKTSKTIGIYEIKGDTMRVCFVEEGNDRPTKFATKKGEKPMIVTYKKVKK